MNTRRTKLFFLLFITSFPTYFFSQESKKDSIINVINTTDNDTLKYELINGVGFTLIFKAPDEFLSFTTPHFSNAKKNKFLLAEADLSNTFGIYHDVIGQKDSAHFYFERSLELSSRNGFKQIQSKAINNLGMFHWNNNNYNLALELFFKAIEINLKETDDGKRFNGIYYNNIGLIYQELKQYEKAIPNHKKSLEIRETYNIVNQQPTSHNNLGICYRNIGIIDSAEFHFLKGLEIAEAINNQLETRKILSNLGNLYQNQGEPDKAIQFYNRSIKIRGDSYEDYKSDITCYVGLLSLYNKVGDIGKAEYHADKASELIQEHPEFRTFIINYYKELAELMFRKGKFDEGNQYLNEYVELKDSIFSAENAKEIANLETLYKTKETEQELLLEKARSQELQLQKLSVEKELVDNKIFLLILLVSALTLLIIGTVLYHSKKRRLQVEKNREILTLKDEHIRNVLSAQENEQKRIAREIHDGLVQDITVIKSLVHESENSKEVLDKLDEVSHEARNISYQLMPLALEKKGFVEALKDLLYKTLHKNGMEYQLNCTHGGLNVSNHVSHNLYRVVQESINNILKHSNASRVDISLALVNSTLVMTVEDNGIGFKKDIVLKGIGFNSMESRLRIMNGSMDVDSETAEGTTITIRIPDVLSL